MFVHYYLLIYIQCGCYLQVSLVQHNLCLLYPLYYVMKKHSGPKQTRYPFEVPLIPK